MQLIHLHSIKTVIIGLVDVIIDVVPAKEISI